MVVVTVVACALFGGDMLRQALADQRAERVWPLLHLALFVVLVLLLVYGNLAYQLARLGYFRRLQSHRPPPFDHLVDWSIETDAPSLVILVPSYKEDLRTIRQTLVSAALQDYPDRRVVLLLDDPPRPTDPEDAARLAAARRLPTELMAWLQEPAAIVQRASVAFAARAEEQLLDLKQELEALLRTYGEIDAWFARQLAATPVNDHTDELFVALAFGAHRQALAHRARQLLRQRADRRLTREGLGREYAHLTTLFRVEVTSFERKRFVNLSHEPSKAANLNSYLGLLGRRVREVRRGPGLHLEVSDDVPGSVAVPDATHVVTLDADSLLAPEYALRLVHLMEQPGNERIAVAQTPYTAVPNPPGVLERVAGATTDLQYIVHQGFTWAGATFWVGANALLRKAALDDIRTVGRERGYPVPRFIQDRTVVEDTESTVDLAARGWQLHNYPERLAFSATPPDFGSLLIQRRRWANGGLLILPKLLRTVRGRPARPRLLLELFLRVHYLISPCTTSISLLGLLVFPLAVALQTPWLPLTAVPYFLLYGRDLRQVGYPRGDLLRVYAFNLMLLPINLAGAVKSLEQGITGKKVPFGRTPKVAGRTAAPAWAVLGEYLLFGYCFDAALWDTLGNRWEVALFSLTTALVLAYVVATFLGVRESLADLSAASRRWAARRPARRLPWFSADRAGG